MRVRLELSELFSILVLGFSLIGVAQQPASLGASGSLSSNPATAPLADYSVSLEASRDQSGLVRSTVDGKRVRGREPVSAVSPRSQQTDLSIYPLPVQPTLGLGQRAPAIEQAPLPRFAGEASQINPILQPSLNARDLDTPTSQRATSRSMGYISPSLPQSSATGVIGPQEPYTANAEATYISGIAGRGGSQHRVPGRGQPSHAQPGLDPALRHNGIGVSPQR